MTDRIISSQKPTRMAVFKVLYLFVVTVAAFAIPAIEATREFGWWVILGLLVLQTSILLRCGVDRYEVLRPLAQLKWLFVVLLACYAFLPSESRQGGDDWRALDGFGWTIWVNLGGIALALLMCIQIITVLLASGVVRLTGSRNDLVVGMRALGLPDLFVYPLDLVLARLGDMHRRQVDSGGRRRASASSSIGVFTVVKRLAIGDVAAFTDAIRSALDDAQDQLAVDSGAPLDSRIANDVAVIAGVGVMMVGFKILKLLPGVPLASGHKMLLLFPLYMLAARLTHARWGGTAAGAVMGVVGFLNGDGRFGIFEVFKHLAPGLVIDLLMPVVRCFPERAWVYCVVGLLASIARLTTEFVVLLLLGARAEVYLLVGAKLVPTLLTGTLSGFVTAAVLRAFPAARLPNGSEIVLETRSEPVAAGREKSTR